MASKTPEEEPEGFYVMEGKRYTISDAEMAYEEMMQALDEVKIEGVDEQTLITEVVKRVQIIMATHYGAISTEEEKLKAKAVQLRSQLRKKNHGENENNPGDSGNGPHG